MSKTERRKSIAELILSMEKPFNLSDLFIKCKNALEIDDYDCILEVLEELCDEGAVRYSEIHNDCWAYSPCA